MGVGVGREVASYRRGHQEVTGAGKTGATSARQGGMSTQHRVLPPICSHEGPPVDVVMWRRCRLMEAGFPEPLAMKLAHATIDLHALLQLVDRGCPPELAARILAPVGLPEPEAP